MRGRPAADPAEPRGCRFRTAARALHAFPAYGGAGPGDPVSGPAPGAAAGPVADPLRGAGPGARFLAAAGDDGRTGGTGPPASPRWRTSTWARCSRGSTRRRAARAPTPRWRPRLARDDQGQLLHPPAGPATDPAFDNKLLAPALLRYDRARTALAAAEDGLEADDRLGALTAAEQEIRALVASRTRPTWDAVWRGIDLLRALPEGAHAEERWTRDRWSFTSHRDRVVAGEPPQPRRDDAVTAANKLAAREREQARLEAQEALDDPLVMAGRRLAGEAFAGEVTDVVMTYSEGKRPSPRPLVTVRTDDRPHLGERAKVYRALGGKPQSAEFVGYEEEGALVVLKILDKMGRGKEPETGSVPEKGDRVCFTLFEHEQRGGAKLPDPEDTPWTHGGPPGEAVQETADPLTPEDVL